MYPCKQINVCQFDLKRNSFHIKHMVQVLTITIVPILPPALMAWKGGLQNKPLSDELSFQV